MSKVYLLVGVPGSGKSWVAAQVKHLCLYLEHDAYIDNEDPEGDYIKDIIELVPHAKKPVLLETPFSVSFYTEKLVKAGIPVKLLYICPDRHTLETQYRDRADRLGKPVRDINKGHLTRNRTFIDRALASGDIVGDSEAVLKILLTLLDS